MTCYVISYQYIISEVGCAYMHIQCIYCILHIPFSRHAYNHLRNSTPTMTITMFKL